MNEPNREQSHNLSIDISADELLGTYANLGIISHSPSEFVFDFARMMPGLDSAKVVRRIIMTPDHAKRFARALVENLHRFENEFGTIDLPEADDRTAMQFNGFNGGPEA